MSLLRSLADRPIPGNRGHAATVAALGATWLVATCAIATVGVGQSVAPPSSTLGTWELQSYYGSATPIMVDLTLRARSSGGDYDDNSSDAPLTSLVGLNTDWMKGPDTDVRFSLVRDAGTFACQGRAGHGRGAGTFEFLPDPNFGAQLASRGYDRPDPDQQFKLAFNDVGLALVDELHAEGYAKPTIAGLVELGIHGVRLEYVRGLNDLGYRVGYVDRLVELRDHGVTPDYIRGLATAGYTKLSSRELLKLRDHGITPRYIGELAKLGYTGLTTDDLLAARDHGVTASWAEGFQRAGYTQLTMQQLVELRDHGVTPAFAASLHHDGAPLPSVRELINRRDRGGED